MEVLHTDYKHYFAIKVDYKNLWRLDRIKEYFLDNVIKTEDRLLYRFRFNVPMGVRDKGLLERCVYIAIPDGSYLVTNLNDPMFIIHLMSEEEFIGWMRQKEIKPSAPFSPVFGGCFTGLPFTDDLVYFNGENIDYVTKILNPGVRVGTFHEDGKNCFLLSPPQGGDRLLESKTYILYSQSKGITVTNSLEDLEMYRSLDGRKLTEVDILELDGSFT